MQLHNVFIHLTFLIFMNREAKRQFDEAMGRSSCILWERTGRHYARSRGGGAVYSDFLVSHIPSGHNTLSRDNGDGNRTLYAEWRDVGVKEREIRVRVHNPDAEEVITSQMQGIGFIKLPLPTGVTLESLGMDAECYDDGFSEKATIERAYVNHLWDSYMAENGRKIRLAREKGSSNVK